MIEYVVISITISLIGLIVIIAKYEKTDAEIHSLKNTIGEFKSQTLCNYLKSIKSIVGKSSNDKTLTGQHKDIQYLLEKEIKTAERRYTEFRIFMDSWIRMSSDINQLNISIQLLEQDLSEQIDKNEKLEPYIYELKLKNRQLNAQLHFQHYNEDREL